jgi:hypothetical protein
VDQPPRDDALALELELSRHDGPIEGIVRLGTQERRFTGWLVLMTALDELRKPGGQA